LQVASQDGRHDKASAKHKSQENIWLLQALHTGDLFLWVLNRWVLNIALQQNRFAGEKDNYYSRS
jgi:hypothetical protein